MNTVQTLMGVQQRRAREREELREEILDAARALFVKEGYDNVSIRKVADKIEYSPGTIYLYFKDKADIFNTLCDETFGKLANRLSAIVKDTDDPIEKLRRAGKTYIQFAIDNPHHYIVSFVQKGERSDTDSNSSDAQNAGICCFQQLRNLVQQAIDAGALRFQDVDEVSQILWAAVHGLSMLLITGSRLPFIESGRLIDRMVDVAMEGIRQKG